MSWRSHPDIILLKTSRMAARHVADYAQSSCLRITGSGIVIPCPQTKRPVPTGLTTDMLVLETLPNVRVPLACRACGQIHRWTPNDAWAADIPKLVASR